jgi:hypothetical protein
MAKIISQIDTIHQLHLGTNSHQKIHFVILMKQKFEILYYISAKMPMTNLKLIF